MTAADLESIRRVYDHWSRGDWTYGVELFEENVLSTTFDADGDEIVLHGRDELRRWFREFLGQWADFRQYLDELVDFGDRALAIGRQTATGRTSGAYLEMPVYNVWTFRNGRVTEFHVTRHEDVARGAAEAPVAK